MDDNRCEVVGWKIGGTRKEELRQPRIVRIGLIQNSIVLPTNSSVADQRAEIFKKIGEYIEHAAKCGVNVVCMQEAWSKFLKL